MARRVLLLSTSSVFGTGYLEHALPEIGDFLGSARSVLFVPFALKDHAGYARRAREALEATGRSFASLHEARSHAEAIGGAEALFVGGGNTFRLLDSLYRLDLLDLIRSRVAGGMPYCGSSAGSNVAGPTIRTTNDMPIVEPPSLAALGLVSFQINPHYADPEPGSRQMGETREERLLQFHEENETPVVALREGAILRVEGDAVVLKGIAGARVFRRDHAPVEVSPGTALEGFLS
jgi:dipeptidase E